MCIGYTDKQGNAISGPSDSLSYDSLVPVYEELAGWEESTVGAKSIEQLPENARAYITRLETLVGAPIDIVSTGPDREETIVLRDPFG